MKTIKRWFGAIDAYFTTGQAARQAQAAMELIGEVRPYIIRAADLAVTLTPSPGDDMGRAAIRAKNPYYFARTHQRRPEAFL